MRLEWLAEDALIARDLPAPPHVLASLLESTPPPGLVEVVAAYETLGIFVDPDQTSLDQVRQWLEELQPGDAAPGRRHEVPVCYDLGEDLPRVCDLLDLSHQELVRLHTESVFQCFAIGFCPGFPYLGHLPDRLAGLPRLPSPRPRVPAGSVAITGRQTGIYPLQRPGGWNLIGRTPLTLVDVESDYFPIVAGDEVRFFAVTSSEYESLLGGRL
ncbi:MAG TPA: 5-oxoprolinase subunit PxpB [Fimbriimonadaceae bacterium]|nr:5-oxoprolinase subunit PxpB [Fimbriimonadaceae bacterium]